LIARESNIIVIRGGDNGSRSVLQQIRQAMEDFFPESQIPDGSNPINEEILPTEIRATEIPPTEIPPMEIPPMEIPPTESQHYSLQRVDTGITSIVGSNNGERPGGFVLVIDGTALRYVSDWLSRCRPRR
jgi:phospholipid-translocating ATPase